MIGRAAFDRSGFFPADPPPEGAPAKQLAAAGDHFARLKSGEIPSNLR